MQGHLGHIDPPLELQNGCKLHARERLHDVENGLFVSGSAFDVSVTFLARQHDKAVRSDFGPELFVVQGFKPVFNVIYVSELHGEMRVSALATPTQIPDLNGRRGCQT